MVTDGGTARGGELLEYSTELTCSEKRLSNRDDVAFYFIKIKKLLDAPF